MLSQKAFAEEFMLLGRCLMDLIPSGSTFNEVDNKLVVDEKRLFLKRIILIVWEEMILLWRQGITGLPVSH